MEKPRMKSKELLELEHKDISSSPAASILRILGEEPKSWRSMPKWDGDHLVTAPAPESEVLGRVKGFLGVLSEANKTLEHNAKEKPEEYDIEVLTGDESNYIEMDLMLGIADLHTPEAIAAAEAVIAGHPGVLNLLGDNSSVESTSSSEDDDEDNNSDEESLQKDNSNEDQSKQIHCPVTTLDTVSQDDSSLKVGLRSPKKERQGSFLEKRLQPHGVKEGPKIVELS